MTHEHVQRFRRPLNFLDRSHTTNHRLHASIFVVLAACGVLGGVLVRSGNGGSAPQQALILPEQSLQLTTPSTTPSGQRAILNPLSSGPIRSLIIGPEPNTVRFAEPATGRLISFDLRTKSSAVIFNQHLAGLTRVLWTLHSPRVITEARGSSGVLYQSTDTTTKRMVQLGPTITSIALSPDGNRIAYAQLSEQGTLITLAQSDGSDPSVLTTTRAERIILSWITPELLLFSSQRSGHSGRDLATLSTHGDFQILLQDSQDLEYTPAPNGDILFSSTPRDGTRTLAILNLESRGIIPLTLSTSARKCAWHPNRTNILCGVPTKQALAQGIATDASATIDSIVRIDTLLGTVTEVWHPDTHNRVSVIDPVIPISGLWFAFTNLFDQRLSAIAL